MKNIVATLEINRRIDTQADFDWLVKNWNTVSEPHKKFADWQGSTVLKYGFACVGCGTKAFFNNRFRAGEPVIYDVTPGLEMMAADVQAEWHRTMPRDPTSGLAKCRFQTGKRQ